MTPPVWKRARLPLVVGLLTAAAGSAGCTGQAGGVGEGQRPPASSVPTEVAAIAETCRGDTVAPGKAPLRRLTRFEYNNTVRDLFGDETQPARALPSEDIGNGFGNDAEAQAVSSLLVEKYAVVAEGIAQRATATPEALGRLHPCAAATPVADEAGCARSLLEPLARRAYRRPLREGELEELLGLHGEARASAGGSFASATALVLEALLQSPDFLYRPEVGEAVPGKPGLRRPTGFERATRLSYLFWGTTPDDALLAAAEKGELDTAEGVFAHASRMLDDARARTMVRFFFDNLLPISALPDAERDPALYPTYSPAIGALLREETQRFLEHTLFDGSGKWSDALTAPYTFVNGPLAAYYGLPGVEGEAFQKVPLDTTKRLGLLTQAGVLIGTQHSNTTNPVTRGSFIVQRLMCQNVPLPGGDLLAQIKPPDPYSGKTARERFSAHSQNPQCAGCHRMMDPVGLPFELYDVVGLYRETENGVAIDASGGLPDSLEKLAGPLDLVRKLAASERTHACFATHWLNFAYGRTVGTSDACTEKTVQTLFARSGSDVRQLLLALTQTDAFLYLSEGEGVR